MRLSDDVKSPTINTSFHFVPPPPPIQFLFLTPEPPLSKSTNQIRIRLKYANYFPNEHSTILNHPDALRHSHTLTHTGARAPTHRDTHTHTHTEHFRGALRIGRKTQPAVAALPDANYDKINRERWKHTRASRCSCFVSPVWAFSPAEEDEEINSQWTRVPRPSRRHGPSATQSVAKRPHFSLPTGHSTLNARQIMQITQIATPSPGDGHPPSLHPLPSSPPQPQFPQQQNQ